MAWVLTAVLAVVVIGLVATLVRQRAAAAVAGDLHAARDTAAARIAALEAEVEAAQAARDTAGARIAALEAEVEAANTARGTTEGTAATLRTELKAAGAASATTAARVTALETEVDAARSARRAAETRAAALEAELQVARSARTAAETRAATLQADLAAGDTTAPSGRAEVPDEGTARPAPPAAGSGPAGPAPPAGGDVRLAAVWALAELAQRRAWRLSLAAPGQVRADGLSGALSMEVERIREEVGTPGSLELRLEPAVAVDDATLALLAARELLATLAPHTQAYDMTVGREGQHLAIRVVCTGWDGPPEAADDIGRLLAAIAPTGADLQLDADRDGRLQATLWLRLLG